MAGTTSTITRTRSTRRVNPLPDYELQFTQPATSEAEPTAVTEAITVQEQSRHPEPTVPYRRVPLQRPINRNLDRSQRMVYTSNAERVFITLMLFGVRVNSVCFMCRSLNYPSTHVL